MGAKRWMSRLAGQSWVVFGVRGGGCEPEVIISTTSFILRQFQMIAMLAQRKDRCPPTALFPKHPVLFPEMRFYVFGSHSPLT